MYRCWGEVLGFDRLCKSVRKTHDTGMFKSILVPIDGSDYSQNALEVSHKLVATNGAKIHLLHVPEFPPARDAIGMAAGATALSYSRQEIEKAGRRVIEKIRDTEQSGQDLIDRVEGAVEPADVETDYIVQMGQPAEVIVDTAPCRVILVH